MSKLVCKQVTVRVYCQGFCIVALPMKKTDQQILALGGII